MKIQALLISFATLSTIALGMGPAQQTAKEPADVTQPAMAPTPAAQPAAQQPSDEELTKLKQQLEALSQMPAEETSEETMAEEPMATEAPQAAPAEQPECRQFNLRHQKNQQCLKHLRNSLLANQKLKKFKQV